MNEQRTSRLQDDQSRTIPALTDNDRKGAMSSVIPRLFSGACLLAVVTVEFLLYNTARTMQDTFGFSLNTILRSLTVMCFTVPVIWGIIAWWYSRFRRNRNGKDEVAAKPLFAAVCIIVIAAAIGEFWISADERAFVREMTHRQKTVLAQEMSRPRAWPNGTGEIGFSAERGYYSTD